jgi:Flp pilus assembly protein TadD
MQKGRIIFLSVPESLREQFIAQTCSHEGHEDCDGHGHGFSINPDIPIPAELPEETGIAEDQALADLSWEMILSGMLRVIQEGCESEEWLDYYREFVLALRPGIIRELSEAAAVKAQNGDYDMALDILNVLVGFFTPVTDQPHVLIRLNRALVLEQRAAKLSQQGKKEASAATGEAMRAYDELMALTPTHPQVFFCAGLFFLSQKEYSRARECFSRHIETSDNEESKKRAEGIISEIIDRGLEDEDFCKARELIQAGKPEDGMRRIRVFLEKQPLVWNGWFMLGWALRLLERWEDGAAAFRKALELGGVNSDTRNELAICLMECGDYSGARKELEAAFRDDPENIKIISNMGVLAMRTGKKEEAQAFFRTALELQGDDPFASQLPGN